MTLDVINKDEAIDNLLSEQNTTKRAISLELEEILYQPIKVLDHGFIRVVDYMGNDNAVVQAARVSYGTGTKQTNQDRGLIHYLMRHRHTTPFEMCEIKFHIKLPIFIARQWIRHRTASVNEYSARYSIMGSDFYLPSKENIAPQSKVNKQCREDLSVPEEFAEDVIRILKEDAEKCYDHYTALMNEDEAGNIIDENKHGIARELARMNLTLNYYTEWYWKIDLHNLLHFLALRADPHAQYEIRAYADAMLDIVKKWVPISYEAFEEYRLKGSSLSKNAVEMIKKMLRGETVTQEQSGMTKREWGEVTGLFEIK
ncbi:MAG: thyX [Rickettsiaceae bacterium]|nr:thyX [Rickettsiaceae bacterium]